MPVQPSPEPFQKMPPRKPVLVAEMEPAFFTAPVARKMSTPPVVPSHGLATRLHAALTVTVEYSGTRMACVPVVAAKGTVSGAVKLRRVAVSDCTRPNCHRPTASLPAAFRLMGVWLPEAGAVRPVVEVTVTKLWPAGTAAVTRV